MPPARRAALARRAGGIVPGATPGTTSGPGVVPEVAPACERFREPNPGLLRRFGATSHFEAIPKVIPEVTPKVIPKVIQKAG